MRSINNSKKGTKNCLNNLIRIREKGFFVLKIYFRDLIIQMALRGCASHGSKYPALIAQRYP